MGPRALPIVLFACAAVAVAWGSDIPIPPEIPLKDELTPLVSRTTPKKSSRQMPEVPREPSPSPIPREVPVDETTIVVGNEVSHRQFMDYEENLQVIMPGAAFGAFGNISKWEVYTGRDCILTVQVFRPAEIPRSMDRNVAPLHAFKKVGDNSLFVAEMGHHSFEIDEDERIHVAPGDVIGFFTTNPGCVSWSNGGNFPVQYRFGVPTRQEAKLFDGVFTAGDGLLKTYSIACTGHFEPAEAVVSGRPSPSSSPSSDPTPSPTPTFSPFSPSPSMTRLPSDKPSTSRTASPSWSPSVTHTPSFTPSPSVNEVVCNSGLEIVCSTSPSMLVCNLSAELCIAALDALGLPLPEHLQIARYELLPTPTPFVRAANSTRQATNSTIRAPTTRQP